MKLLSVLSIAAAVFVNCTAIGGSIVFSYDRAGRVTNAAYLGGKSISYRYDTAGNLTSKTVAVPTDSDGDGMTDSWETTYFGNLGRNGSGDFDGDGMSDLAEFLAGTLPNNASSALRITTFSTATGVSATVQWSSVAGKIYRLEYKNSVSDASWTVLPGEITASSTTSTKTDTDIPGELKRFYRVTLVQ